MFPAKFHGLELSFLRFFPVHNGIIVNLGGTDRDVKKKFLPRVFPDKIGPISVEAGRGTGYVYCHWTVKAHGGWYTKRRGYNIWYSNERESNYFYICIIVIM